MFVIDGDIHGNVKYDTDDGVIVFALVSIIAISGEGRFVRRRAVLAACGLCLHKISKNMCVGVLSSSEIVMIYRAVPQAIADPIADTAAMGMHLNITAN